MLRERAAFLDARLPLADRHRMFRLAALLVATLATAALAQGRVERIPTRTGIVTPVYWETAPGAKATVLLFSGGNGGMGAIVDGRPASGNFLVRSVPHFLANGLNVAVYGKPSDVAGLDPAHRQSDEHVADVRAVVEFLHKASGQPVWLVGTSRGTTSVAHVGANLRDAPVAGLVLSSSITSFRDAGAVANRDLSGVRVPVLVHHHEKDECPLTQARELSWIVRRLDNAPVKKVVLATGGANPRGDPCEAFHWHGYIGMERQAVDEIAAFIKAPGP
jgi:predicted alpha/beta-hydrolase family hydrolase